MTSRPFLHKNRAATLALLPIWLLVLCVFVGTAAYTFYLSFTASGILPNNTLVGAVHYTELFHTRRWNISLANMGTLCVTYVLGCLVMGFLLAAALDRNIRCEAGFRTVFLYPQAISFVVTGLIWQWLMNPDLGVQAAMHSLGWASFRFDWTQDRDMAIYAVAIAGVWQGSGLAMVLMLAGLRGVDATLWQAARVEGIPMWRTYVSIILPELKPAVMTAATLLFMGIIKTYDLVVSLTNGGPGSATELPAKFVMDNLFMRQNIGLAAAGASVLLITVLAVLVPVLYARALGAGGRARHG